MATYYPSLSNQRNALPTPYLQDQKLDTYPESPYLPSNVMYLSQASAAGSFADLLSANSLSPHNCVETPCVGSRNEVVFIPRDPVSMQSIGGQLNITTGVPFDNCVTGDPQMVSRTKLHVLDGEKNLQYQGLSLSLGTQIPSEVHMPSTQYQHTNPGLSCLLSSHVSDSGDAGSQSRKLRNSEYISFDLAGGIQNAIKFGDFNISQWPTSPKETHSDHLYETSDIPCTALKSKYLKAAQQLLDEIVRVCDALKQPELDEHDNAHNFGLDSSKETDGKCNYHSVLPSMNAMSSDLHGSTTNYCELLPAEWQDLQSKMTKLLSFLDEVDRRYKEYHHQMQIVVSSFEMVTGCGAAKPYTALALQTISHHFRCLRDAINRQIQVTRQRLGKVDAASNRQGGRLSCLDQKLRRQRALQQVGMVRHCWRPQRGLPESSVSILRAWLFEHFLNPYPKDSEKIMLARQTGLTRSQVANWFINARVRLWKPMVEEMYKEEFGDLEALSKSSPEHAPKATDESWASEDGGEVLQKSVTSTAADVGHLGQSSDSKSDLIPDVEMKGCTERLSFQNGCHGDDNIDCGVMKLQVDRRPSAAVHSLCPDEIIPSNRTGDGSLMAAAATYDVPVLGGFAVGNQVSLVLGLQHSEKDPMCFSGGMQLKEDDATASSVGLDIAEYHCVDPITQQHRFGNPHLLSDFVA